MFAKLYDYSDPNSLGSRFRRARSKILRKQIEDIYAQRGECRIIDLGGTETYWNIFEPEFLSAHGVRITLVNVKADKAANPLFESISGDACALPFSDNHFDLAHSNSVVEHVGSWEKMRAFAEETRRVAPSYYVQTPYFWFPVEPHYRSLFLHWFPDNVKARTFSRRRLGGWAPSTNIDDAMSRLSHAQLLDKWQFAELFPDAEFRHEQIAGITKSLVAVRERPAA